VNIQHGIPTRHAASIRRAGAATAAIFIAVVSVAVVVAPTSAAEPKRTPGAQAFMDCFSAAWDKNPTMSYATKQKVAEDCCLNLGGIFNESTHTCYLPANNITVAEPTERPVPPSGATAVLPPGVDTRSIG
jgi:hypothetical protein